ncbi:MAG: leucyl/phenylalanyl-tRNA--protein transferase [Gammaproteobacteria bacterium]|nr:MAG: leucyl/phenylalanyl-tRNA--protein transferase [Gammaproteobacteria bacterium]
MSITWLEASSTNSFPPVEQAFDDGLLAAGGDLSTDRLLSAYRHGIFPWFNKNDPILWWSPDPRMVLFTDQVKISKSLKKTLRTTDIHISMDRAFDQVMLACSAPRANQPLDPENSSWIHPQMIGAYTTLHQQGYAHSIECWQQDELIGGLYGVAIGNAFFGESMFSTVRDSSKIALVALCQQLSRWGFPIIDCQVHSEHLARLGAQEISRHDFISQLNMLCPQSQELQAWQLDKDLPEIP